MVGKIAKIIINQAPKNLPNTRFKVEMGLVNKNSMVPVLNSSEKERMVIAGTKIIRMKGVRLKNEPISA